MKFQLMVMLALAITPCRLSAEAGSAVGTNAPPKPAELVFGVRSYVVEGNDGLLPPEAIVGVLSNYTGSAVAIERLREGVGALQSLYRNRGFTNVNVELPHQRVTNGVVRVWVIPGTLSDIVVKGNRNFGSENASRASPSLTTNVVLKAEPGSVAGTNAPPKPAAPVFEVRSYLVEGNHGLLAPEAIAGVLSNYTGSAVAFERLRQGLGALQLLYRERGFATVNVALPHQRITNGVVRVRVIPGTLSDIVVKGNRYFSSENVRRALPSLTTNVVLNTKWFQPELDRANVNPDRQIYPVINPGPEPETSALTLNVKDQLPLHGHMEVNDKSTPGTPLLRIDSAVQYNNLWQLEHQIGLEYNFSPQSMKSDNYRPNFYDQPMVASYSGFYRLPLGLGQNLRETYDQMPVDFGYDQVTHRFNLPPPTGNPELIVYASRSSSEMPTRLGPVTLITNTALADISSQSSESDLTISENLGTKLTIPLQTFGGVRSSLLLGFDYKSYEQTSYSTNLTYFDLYALDNYGNRVLVTNKTIALGTVRGNTLNYMPLSVGWTGMRPDKWGSTSLTWNQSAFLTPLASPRSGFEKVAGSTAAGGNYTVLTAGLSRQEKLFGDWSAVCKAGGQWSSAPLISNEQFALGGTSGVRGYQEGENYGDTGWRVLFDLRAPPLNVGYFPTSHDAIPADLRCSWFMDYGETYLMDRPPTANDRIEQWGTGLGFYLTVGQHVDARLTLGWALHDTPTTKAGSAQGYFNVGFQF